MRRWIAAVFVAVAVAGCGSSASTPTTFVDFTERFPIPAEGTGNVKPLRVAVAAILSPEGTVESYGVLANYLGEKLGRPVEIVQRRTYEEINDLLESGEVGVGFVCTSAYVAGRDDFGMQLVAAPEIEGESTYRSALIVGTANPAESMADLEGAVFAFTDPMSMTGRAYPTYLVQQLGAVPETFFERTIFTYSHDHAIEAVAEGLADAAAVDSLVLDHALERDPDLAGKIRVIALSAPFGIPPVVTGPGVTAIQAAEIRELLVSLSTAPDGGDVLRSLGIDRFVPIEDEAYDGVRAIIDAVDLDR